MSLAQQRRGEVWCGDLLRAGGALAADDAALLEIATLLGLAEALAAVVANAPRRPAVADSTAAPARTDTPADRPPAAPRLPPGDEADTDPPMASHRLPSTATRVAAGPPAAAPDWLAEAEPLHLVAGGGRLVSAAPLLPALQRRALLSAALSTVVEEGPADVPRIVRELARGQPLRRLPRQRRRTLRHGVHLRIDRAPWLQPHFDDQLGLLAYLRRLLPPDRVSAVFTEGGPMPPPEQPGRGRRARSPVAAPRPTSPAPVLLLSDLGLGYRWQGPAPAPLAEWRQFVHRVQRQGRHVLALAPHEPARLPAVPGLAVLRWSERCSVSEAWRSRAGLRPAPRLRLTDDDDLDRLAEALSPALRVTPWLLREARRQLGLEVAAEAAFAFSDRVQSFGTGGLVLVPEVAAAARARLAASPRRDAALALCRRARGAGADGRPGPDGARDGSALEEQLIELELLAPAFGAATLDDAAVGLVLRPALKTLAEGDDAAAAATASWAAHAWARFSPAVRGTLAARQLAYAAAARVRTRGWLAQAGAPRPPLPAASGWLFAGPEAELDTYAVELRHYADGSINLVIGPAQAATTALHRIELPRLQPLWLEVVDEASGAAQTVLVDSAAPTQVDLGRFEPGRSVELRPLLGDAWRLGWPAAPAAALRGALLRLPGTPAGEVFGLALPGALLLAPFGPRALNGSLDPVQRLSAIDAHDGRARGEVSPLGRIEMPPASLWVLRGSAVSDAQPALPFDVDAHPPAGDGTRLVFLAFDPAVAAAVQTLDASVLDDQPSVRPASRADAPPADGLVLDAAGRWHLLRSGASSSSSSSAPRKGGAAQKGARDTPVYSRPLDEVLAAAHALAEDQWRGLLLATPHAGREAFTLWDLLRERVGNPRVAHDHDGRILGAAATLARQLDDSDWLILVGHDLPDAATQAALRGALERGLRLVWLPLVDGGAAAPLLEGWPADLRHALQVRQWLTGTNLPVLADTLARPRAGAAAASLEASERASEAAAPDTGALRQPPATPPAPRSFGASLRQKLAAVLESHVTDPAQRGLMRVRLQPTLALEAFTMPRGDEPPWLLFLHGEASDTLGSFGDLLLKPGAEREQLSASYGERLIAWQHRSVTVGPLAHALALAESLPPATVLHIVSLGAGGLIGELLARGERVDGARAFETHEIHNGPPTPGAEPDQALLMERLAQVLAERRLRIERFVRVACPVAGTPVYATGSARSSSLVGLLPGIGAALSLLPGIDRLLTDPDTSPGLAGLAPGSGVQPWLTTAVRTTSALTVIAGVARPRGVFGRLGALAARMVGGTPADSDLVVALGSAFGGLEREHGVDWLVAEGDEVSHFNFFRNAATRRAIVEALVGRTPPAALMHAPSLAELQQRFGTTPGTHEAPRTAA